MEFDAFCPSMPTTHADNGASPVGLMHSQRAVRITTGTRQLHPECRRSVLCPRIGRYARQSVAPTRLGIFRILFWLRFQVPFLLG